MIKYLVINNFKSIEKISLTFGKFNCLIGMNGAGKSTLLQAIDFISRQMSGAIDDWLIGRGWESKDLSCKLSHTSNILFMLGVELPSGDLVTWVARFNRNELRCTNEHFHKGLISEKERIFSSDGQHYLSSEYPKREINFKYQGSLLSQLKDSELPELLVEFRNSIRRIKSLELLSPHLLRKRARSGETDIGAGGEKLSAYLHSIKGEPRQALIKLLQQFYPALVDFKVSNMRAGWKRLSIIEQYGTQKLETDSSHINDGLLRILAVLAQTQSDRAMVLLDEIENGINPEIVEKLVNVLAEAPQQIVVTTHSPMILNYLDDRLATEAVQFVYKSPQGLTNVRLFFKIPRIKDKLQYMGPGEAFVDTNLIELTAECVADDVAADAAAAQELARKTGADVA